MKAGRCVTGKTEWWRRALMNKGCGIDMDDDDFAQNAEE
jgi:hypothetical protein